MAPGTVVTFVCDSQIADEFNGRGDGNPVQAGDELPAMIVRSWGSDYFNLRVFRDAKTDGWITSVGMSTEENHYLRSFYIKKE